MLIIQQGTVLPKTYAIFAYSSAIAKTTSSSYFLVKASKYGNKVFLIASGVINVATIDTLWMVFTLEARSSDSSSYLNRSKAFILSILRFKVYLNQNYFILSFYS